jgi:hypothetical protein
MRWKLFAPVLTLLLHGACSEPHCAPGEHKIGETCHQVQVPEEPNPTAALDAATPLVDAAMPPEAPGESDASSNDSSPSGAASPSNNDTNAGSSDGGPRGGNEGSAIPDSSAGDAQACSGATCPCGAGYERLNGSCVQIVECSATLPCADKNQLCRDVEGFSRCTCRPNPNLVRDPSFEQQASYSVGSPWNNFEGAWIETAMGSAHEGTKSAVVATNKDWNDVWQRVPVEPNTTYKLQAWIRTSWSGMDGADLGVRSVPDWETTLARTAVPTGPNHRLVTAVFTTGSQREVDIYIGTWAVDPPRTLITVDDVSLVRQLTSGGSSACP